MKFSKGFTLIELLVIIAIIALLSSVVLASVSVARIKARDSRRISDLQQIKNALEMYYDAKGYYPGNYMATPKCVAPPCWDNNSYARSNQPAWQMLTVELGPYIKLPVDPLNTPTVCTPTWRDDCHYYVYGNASRYGVNALNFGVTTTKDTYDLAAILEDVNNPLTCKFNDYKFGNSFGTTTYHWCTQNGGAHSNAIYDISPVF